MDQILTEKGYDFFELLSFLQKAIRRGKEYEAHHCAVHLEKFNPTALWNKLEVIASEDIGVANPILPLIIRILRLQYEEAAIDERDSYRIFLSNAIILLSRSPKSRVADDLLRVVYSEIQYEDKLIDIPDYAFDHHTRRVSVKEGIEKFISEGTVLVNRSNDSNPYTDRAHGYLRKYRKLPKEFPKLPSSNKRSKKKSNKDRSNLTDPIQSKLQ